METVTHARPGIVRRLLVRLALGRAADLRWRAFGVRIRAKEDYPDPACAGARRAEVEARLLDLRAAGGEALAEWLGGR